MYSPAFWARAVICTAVEVALFFIMGRGLTTARISRGRIAIVAAVLFVCFASRRFMLNQIQWALGTQVLRAAVCTVCFYLLYRIQRKYAFFLGAILTELIGIWRATVYLTIPWLLHSLFGWSVSIPITYREILVEALSVACVLLLSIRWIRIDPQRKVDGRELLVTLLPSSVCFVNLMVLHFEVWSPGLDYAALDPSYPILVLLNAFAVVAAVVASEQYFTVQSQRRQLEEADQQIRYQYQLFLDRQTNRENLRIVYHDLKNHLSTLRALSEEKSLAYIDELSHATKDELAAVDTGNATLNVLIEQKRDMCSRRGIDLKPYVNFKDGGFLSQMEVCALFGNAIDNAAEAIVRDGAQGVPADASSDGPSSAPQISLTGGTVAGCLFCQVGNPCKDDLSFAGGLPKTTKAEAGDHGLGLLSIKRIVESHGGTMTITVGDGTFTLKWLIPIP